MWQVEIYSVPLSGAVGAPPMAPPYAAQASSGVEGARTAHVGGARPARLHSPAVPTMRDTLVRGAY
jgi:hypothetical protein